MVKKLFMLSIVAIITVGCVDNNYASPEVNTLVNKCVNKAGFMKFEEDTWTCVYNIDQYVFKMKASKLNEEYKLDKFILDCQKQGIGAHIGMEQFCIKPRQ